MSPHPTLKPAPVARLFASPVWAAVAAFGTYFCMYGLRKPFTAATFADRTLWGLDFKSVLVIAQVLGYTLSKFCGIRIIAEMRPAQRAGAALLLVGIAQLALVLFGLTPAPYNVVWLFMNGLPLGMVFGLVLGFLEGRRNTELLTAALCTSFIVADGVVKSAGAAFLQAGVSEFWMPALTGFVFLPPLAISVWMLTRIPAPSPADVAARSERTPMNATDRWSLARRYAPGLTLIGAIYLFVTILRSVRADFAAEIWKGLGVSGQPEVFGWSETVVGAVILGVAASLVLIRDNRRAFFTGLTLALAGGVITLGALAGHQLGRLAPFPFMVLVGLGLYLPYFVVHTTLFERLIAMTRDRGNIGYLLYLVDAYGYLGYVVVLLARNVAGSTGRFLPFFLTLSWGVAALILVLLLPAWWYFAVHPAIRRAAAPASPLRARTTVEAEA